METAPLLRPHNAMVIRVCIAATTIAIIVAGALYVVRGGPSASEGRLDANFFGLVIAASLPSVIYLLGVRTPRLVVVYGLLLLGITAFGWVFVFVEDDAMRGVLTFPAFFITLGTSIHGFVRDRRIR